MIRMANSLPSPCFILHGCCLIRVDLTETMLESRVFLQKRWESEWCLLHPGFATYSFHPAKAMQVEETKRIVDDDDDDYDCFLIDQYFATMGSPDTCK
jgi:hypothetical protein